MSFFIKTVPVSEAIRRLRELCNEDIQGARIVSNVTRSINTLRGKRPFLT